MTEEMNGWVIQRLGERIDSFNQGEFKSEMDKVLEKGALQVALDLQNTKFLSFPCIQLIVTWANQLRNQGGKMMLIAPSEKLKRQIFIYGSLDHLIVTKSQELAAAPIPQPKIPEIMISEDRPAFESPVPDESFDF